MIKFFSCLSLVFCCNLFAMDQDNSLHAPRLKKELLKFFNAHVENENSSLKDDVGIGAFIGWYTAFSGPGILGEDIFNDFGESCSKDAEPSSIKASAIIFFPVSLLLSLPMAAVGALGGLGANLCNSIKAKIDEKVFDYQVALHVYQWMNVIKQGRFALRGELQDWLKTHENQDSSLCEAAKAVLQGDKFNQYFGSFNFSHEEMLKILSQVDINSDNFDNLFEKLSMLVKTSKLSDQEWLKLEEALINFENKTGFPELSPEEVKTYLYVSVYYFILVNYKHDSGINWLKSLIS